MSDDLAEELCYYYDYLMQQNSPLEERRAVLKSLLPRLQSAASFLPFYNDTFPSPPEGSNHVRILILRLSPYQTVEESITHLVLYDQIRRYLPNSLIDFAFLPPRADRSVFFQAGLGWPLSIQTLGTPQEFDIVFITLSYVLECINIPQILAAAGIPYWASNRPPNNPLIIAGGSSSLSAQSLLKVIDSDQNTAGPILFDSPIDAFFFGEFEESAESLLTLLFPDGKKTSNTNRSTAMATLKQNAEKVTGLWIPSINNSVQRAVCNPKNGEWIPQTYPVLNSSQALTCRLQISYGCPFSCSFCFEGFERKPYRDIQASHLLQAAADLHYQTGASSLDLISFNFNTHVQIEELLLGLQHQFPHIHFMSQRLDILNRKKFLLENEISAGKRSFTLGIEGISTRIRNYYEKKLDSADIQQICARLLQARVKEIKLFYIASGLETYSDYEEFSVFLSQLENYIKMYGFSRLIFSFGILMRMPFTPLQFGRTILTTDFFQGTLHECKKLIENHGFEFRTAFSNEEFQLGQILALGNFDTWQLVDTLHNHHIDYENNLPTRSSGIIQRFIESKGYFSGSFAAEKTADYQFPMDFVANGYSRSDLLERYQYCVAALEAPGSTANISPSTPRPGADLRKKLSALIAAKSRLETIYCVVVLPGEIAGALPTWIDAWLVRQLFRITGSTELIHEAHEHYHSEPDRLPWHGFTVISITTTNKAQVIACLERLTDSDQQESISANSPELIIVQVLDSWKGGWTSLELVMELSGYTPQQIAASCQKLCAALHIGATLRKSNQTTILNIAPKYKNKKQISSIEIVEHGPGSLCRLTVGANFNPGKGLRSIYPKGQLLFSPVAVTGLSLSSDLSFYAGQNSILTNLRQIADNFLY